MTERYTGHWYEEDRLRGSGFRSISFDNRLDPVLVAAAKRAGIDSKLLSAKELDTDVDKVMVKLLDRARGKIMFINPGEVKVANAALLSAPPRCIWDKANGVNKSGFEWEEELTPSYKTQFDGVSNGDTFESPLASPPSTPHVAPVATTPSPSKTSLPTPANSQTFYPGQPFKSASAMRDERMDEQRGSTSSSEASPSGTNHGPFSHSLSHNHNLNLTHSHNLNLKNGGAAPRPNYLPPPHASAHLGAPNAHNHHTNHPHHSSHANIGGSGR